jgi:type II secretory pathway component GspD/PulD (secretin)
MKFSYSSLLTTGCCIALLSSSAMGQLLSLPNQLAETSISPAVSVVASSPQDTDGEQEQDIQSADNDKMLLNCKDWGWQRVIEVFTEKTGLDLQPIDEYPDGSVTIYSEEPYTVMEGLDKLNMNLAIKGYTLIRKDNQLFLIELRNMSDDMAAIIENVPSEELVNRGLNEVMRVTFDLSGLDADLLEDSISSRITNRTHRNHLLYIPAAKRITVQETGSVLREIAEWVRVAREEAVKKALGRRKYTVENLPVEILLELARPMIGMDEGTNDMVFEDGTKLTMVSDPIERIIWLRSSNEKMDEAFEVFKEIDVAPPETEIDVARKYLAKHPVGFDQELAMQIVQSFFEGRDVTLDQDAQSGAILLYGTEKDHQDADDYLDVGASDARNGIKSIPLNYLTQTEAITLVNQALGITVGTDGTVTGNGPKIIPIPGRDAIFVMGTPQQVIQVRTMITELDVASDLGTGTPLSNSRFLPMTDTEALRLLDGDLADKFRSTGRANKLNISRRQTRTMPRRMQIELDEMEEEMENSFDLPPENAPKQSDPRNDQSSNDSFDESRYQFTSTQDQDQDQDNVGKTSEDVKQDPDDYYVPPAAPESIPGSPIELKMVDGGIMVESDDLSALVDMVDFIQQLQSDISEEDIPAIFPVTYRRPDVVKSYLDQYIGLAAAGGGGGGGGGLGGVVGDVVGNALGGGGDLFGGLFGDMGGGETGGGYVLEGDVSTFADNKLNYILVKGHTVNDYDMIAMYIDLLDRPDGFDTIDLIGETQIIPVIYRDAQEVYDLILPALKEYVDTGDSGGGGGQPDPNQALQAIMRNALGGGGGGGGGSEIDNEAEKPKATISVDTTKSALIVTGPQFIYETVAQMVSTIDAKPTQTNEEMRMINIPGVDPALVAQFIETYYSGKLTIVEGEAGATEANGTARNNSQDNANQRAQEQQRAQMIQNFQRAVQQQQRAGGGGRGGGGGGRGGGGGGRGGGGGGRGGR